MSENILHTSEFAKAVTQISKRADGQEDSEKLTRIYVGTDLPSRCEALDHQLILGRRGTGKTHLLRFFERSKQGYESRVFYCDCTRLASGLGSLQEEPSVVAARFFSVMLNDLANFLLDETLKSDHVTKQVQEHAFMKLESGLVRFSQLHQASSGSFFNYRQIADTLAGIIDDLRISRLFLVLDEWAQVPNTSQPYFAEFIKRSLLQVRTVSVKILAVSYFCRFSQIVNGNLIGMQRGADITDVIDMDRYLVYDENNQHVIDFFGQLLYNHLGVELGWNLSVDKGTKVKQIRSLFTQESAFNELVRAAEGNSRDFICIFARAYQDSFLQSAASKHIGIPQICNAAGSWYSTEKEAQVKFEPYVQETLSYLQEKVLRGYKSRSFLVESGKEEHPRLIRLLNERILHRLNETYSHQDRPGVRYGIYTLDYGAYVSYRGTSNMPRQEIFFESDAEVQNELSLVPLNDKRSIRRIVFDPEKCVAST